jgi:arsenite-transporting ATPase
MNPQLAFLSTPPRILFFTGKGGVGKTSIACAASVYLAERGKRVLLVSTDPASNLDEVLGTRLAGQPTAIDGCPNLHALNIDPQAAAASYREGVIGPLRGLLPEATLRSIEEGLSGACTVEIAAFDRFCQLLTEPTTVADYDHLLFDTAPTGHTLRLLKLPAAWDSFLGSNTTGTTCIGPLAGLATKRETYERAVHTLGDAATTLLVLVTRPETGALLEAARTSGELASEGIANQCLVINGRFSAQSKDPLALLMAQRADAALEQMPEELQRLTKSEVALSGRLPLGLGGLRALLGGPADNGHGAAAPFALQRDPDDLPHLLHQLAEAGHGVILTAGKGGVGKTTLAAAIAVGLAERGHTVHLTTTDPAAHLALTLGDELAEPAKLPAHGAVSGTTTASRGTLTVCRIDPAFETATYQAEVIATAGAGLDAPGRALLEEDLRSPCTEEIAVFRAFARTVAQGTSQFVVIDTAPTGHTLLLLDAAEAYHREVERNLAGLPDEVKSLLPRLRDPEFTRLLLVTLPEATPVHEALALQDDLRRAGITPWGWVVNQSLHGHPLTDPVLVGKQKSERPYLNEVLAQSKRVALLRWQSTPPVGRPALAALSVRA